MLYVQRRIEVISKSITYKEAPGTRRMGEAIRKVKGSRKDALGLLESRMVVARGGGGRKESVWEAVKEGGGQIECSI